MVFGNIKHEFICTDPGHGKLYWFDKEGKITKELGVSGACFDVWVLPDGNILYPHYFGDFDGVSIVTPDGEEVFRYQTRGEVFGCQPLENGNILTGELVPKRLCEVDRNGNIVKEIPVPYDAENGHECMRMPRKVKDGYLVIQPGLNKITRFDLDGNLVRQYDTYHDTFGVLEEENGNILYTYMDGLVELDPEGNEIWHLRDEDVPGMNIRWLLGVQLMKNGNIAVTNWLGHGHDGEGIPFFEVNRNKEVVWYCDARDCTSVPAVMQILDETENKAEVCFTSRK